MFGITAALLLVFSASILSPAFSTSYPFHAQCSLQWSWSESNCSVVHDALIEQIKMWNGTNNCKSGGERCLYELESDEGNKITLHHTTPVRSYVDDVTFKFCGDKDNPCTFKHFAFEEKENIRLKRGIGSKNSGSKDANQCIVSGFSKSKVWYAVLDYGTNYCNMRNLIDGTGLSDRKDFTEATDDSICTQYSSAKCDEY